MSYVIWFKGPSGKALPFLCGPDGLNIPTLAEELKLEPRPLKLNGLLVDFDSRGYASVDKVRSFLKGLGSTEKKAIPVTGEPAGRAAAGAAAGDAAEIVEYLTNPVGHTDFSFDAPLPQPIEILKPHALLGQLVKVPHACQDVVELVNGNRQSELAHYVVNFVLNDKIGTSEDGLHGRDDSIMKIIARVAGVVRPQRNKISDGSTVGLRFDATIGQPPLVVIVEKDLDGKLQEAKEETHRKIAWIPHYAKLPFIVGIAIAGDVMEVRAISKYGLSDSPKPVTFDLTKLDGRLRAVRAAVNIGLLCKYVRSSQLVPSVSVPFNTPSVDARRSIVVTWQQVEKTYINLPDERQQVLCDFYRENKSVPFLEQLIGEPQKVEGKLKLRLKPVGLADHRPQTVQEAKVSMHCVLTALGGCHGKQWAHQDVRWANVIQLESEQYVLIDCEFADRFGSDIPTELKVKPPDVSQCSAGTDLWLVGQMLGQLQQTIKFDEDLKRLLKLLTSWKKCKDLTVGDVFKKFPWIKTTTPQQSPGKGDKPSQQQQLQQHHAKSGVEQAGTVQKKRSKRQSKGTGQSTEGQGSNNIRMGTKRSKLAARETAHGRPYHTIPYIPYNLAPEGHPGGANIVAHGGRKLKKARGNGV